jgi:glutamate formiminotransferase/glutamate formiminotransferase/formiminotetrahydrofolate cyclodeaminase
VPAVLLAVPNVSEGRDSDVIAAVRAGFERELWLLDEHTDPTHNRTVYTLARDQLLWRGLVHGAASAIQAIDMRRHDGAHPCIGALDVCPVVYLRPIDRELARQDALDVAEALGKELEIPVFLYGELASADERRERSYFRRGGLAELTRRMRSGELGPDRGPGQPHPTAGATLVTARPPLAAFNVELADAEIGVGRAIAALLRESGAGLEGVRAIGIDLDDRRTQVSTNVHDPVSVPLGRVIEEIRRRARVHGPARPISGEVVGLVPEAALEGLPDDVPLGEFDPARQVIERRLASAS